MTGRVDEGRLPPGQQLAAATKWPLVGERTPAEHDGPWAVSVTGLIRRPATFTVEELCSLGWTERTLDIHCVTRWSKLGMHFGGVLLEKVLAHCEPLASAQFVNFKAASARGHSTSLQLETALELEVLLAMECDGRPLPAEHGGPLRVVTPDRYFYKSLKWLVEIELLAEDRLGYWEESAGYHNEADPWREQRYLAADLSRSEARRMFESRDLRGRELRGFFAQGQSLAGLQAEAAILRNADFRDAILNDARFDRANLSNANFEGADLQGASFREADAEGADFSGADLRSADFRGAMLTAAVFVATGPDRSTLAARFDAGTKFDASVERDLMPQQLAYLRDQRMLRGDSDRA